MCIFYSHRLLQYFTPASVIFTPTPLLSRVQYVSEAVAAIAEAPLKISDVPAALAISCLLHQRYADFGPQVQCSSKAPKFSLHPLR